MDENRPNPFDPPAHVADERVSIPDSIRSKNRLILIGSVALVASGLGVVATVVAMNWVFAGIAKLEDAQPGALADTIGVAVIPAVAAMPTSIFGIYLVVSGVSGRARLRRAIDD